MCSGMETRKEVVLEVKRLNGYGFFFKQSFKKRRLLEEKGVRRLSQGPK